MSPSGHFWPHFPSPGCCEHYDEHLTREKCGVCPDTGITVYRPKQKIVPPKARGDNAASPRTRKRIIYNIVEKLVDGRQYHSSGEDTLSSGSILSTRLDTASEETSVELDEVCSFWFTINRHLQAAPSSSDFSVSLSSVVTRLASSSSSIVEGLQMEEYEAAVSRRSLSSESLFDVTQSDNSQASY